MWNYNWIKSTTMKKPNALDLPKKDRNEYAYCTYNWQEKSVLE